MTAVPIISHIQVLWYVVCTQNFEVLETFPSFSVRQGDPASLKGKYEASLSFERVIEPCLQWVPFVCSAHTSHFLERNGLPANDISVLKAHGFFRKRIPHLLCPFPLSFTFHPCSVQCTDQHTFRQLLISTSFDDLEALHLASRSRLEECGGTGLCRGAASPAGSELCYNSSLLFVASRPFPSENKTKNKTRQSKTPRI